MLLVYHDKSLLGKCFRGFVLPVLEYCSALWRSAADTHSELLDRVVTCAHLLNEGVFECAIAHRRSVAVLCMLYRSDVTRCTHFMMFFQRACDVPVRITRGVLVITFDSSLQNMVVPQELYSPLSALWGDLADPVFDGVGLAGFKSMVNDFLLYLAGLSLYVFNFSLYLFFCLYVGILGLGSSD